MADAVGEAVEGAGFAEGPVGFDDDQDVLVADHQAGGALDDAWREGGFREDEIALAAARVPAAGAVEDVLVGVDRGRKRIMGDKA